jgi:ABC-type multidrug transport system fused ATPase/permease subunit
MGLSATGRLHTSAFTAMMRSPMAFFNLTPVGKTLNVFAKDFDTIDDVLHDNFYQVSYLLFSLLSTFFLALFDSCAAILLPGLRC